MKNKRTLLIRAAVVLVLIAICALMMVIGRGHTVYFDNVAIDYEGTHYDTPYKVSVYVKGEQAAKLYDGERGMAVWIGQNFEMELKVMDVQGGSEELRTIRVKLPYHMDGIVLNLPGLLHELPEDAWLSLFVSNAELNPVEDDAEPSDEFGTTAEF